VVCSLPITVTDDVPGARERINHDLKVYGTLPSYAKMLEREGAREVADVALVGSKQQVLEQLNGLAEAGVTEFSGAPSGTEQERESVLEVLLEYGSLNA
jgi:alkanesulfonate monooxygenase SsuD/methylene tetrahydromethanopterin reductase-like flavin-dependent oxidoreductase (luciferase family)